MTNGLQRIEQLPEPPKGGTLEALWEYIQRLHKKLQEAQTGRLADFDQLNLRNVPWVDARSFGFSESASAAKNKAALVDAMASLGTTDSGTVRIPRGNFAMVGDIDPPVSNMIITGASPAFTYSEYTTPATTLTFASGTRGFDLRSRKFIRLKNMLLDGDGNVAIGVDIKSHQFIDHCSIKGFTTAGAQFASLVNMTRISNSSLSYNTGWGLKVINNNNDNTIAYLDHVVINSNTLGGVFMEAGRNIEYQTCVIEANVGPGLSVVAAGVATPAYITFDNVWFEQNGDAGTSYQIEISAAANMFPYDFVFRRCKIAMQPDEKGISVSAINRLVFDRTTIDGGLAAYRYVPDGTESNVTWIGGSHYSSPITGPDPLPTAQAENLIPGMNLMQGWNGGFDSVTERWAAIGGSGQTTLASVAGGQSGNCLEITRVSDTYQGAWFDAVNHIRDNHAYRITFYVKSGTSGNEAFKVGVYDNAGATTVDHVTGTSSGSWVQYELIIKGYTWAGAGNTYIGLIKNSATAGTMLFDTVEIQELPLTVNGKSFFDGTVITSGQVAFPSTQNPSTDGNILDDYEEGTWTPTDGSGAALTFTSTAATYTKIGRLVTLAFHLAYPATADGSAALISGLPFTSLVGTYYWGGCTTYTNAGIELHILVDNNAVTFSFRKSDGSTPTNANLSGKTIRGVLNYVV